MATELKKQNSSHILHLTLVTNLDRHIRDVIDQEGRTQ